jgi:hypothetical protein
MDLFERQDLRRLAETNDEYCVSMYIPTARFESESSQNPIRFKNALKTIREQLKDHELRDAQIDEILAPAEQLIDRTAFWRSLSDGLALFLTPDSADVYRLPLRFDETVVVSNHFHLKPLFPLIASNNRFYVLGLSKNSVRLYQGTHYALDEVSSADIPSNIVEAILQYEDPEKQIQHHTAKRTSRGRQDAQFHGHGVSSEDTSGQPKDQLRRFFRKIDESLRERLRDEDAPLVLASVREYLPYYKEVNQYPHLVDDDVVAGNFEDLSTTELHEKAWSIVAPRFQENERAAVQRFSDLYHTEEQLASDDFHEIIPAAAYSRVETLFVPIGEHRWGTYDRTSNTVQLHAEQQTGDEDLLNYAAIHAFLSGAEVHALKPTNMPNGFSLAATFRYPSDVAADEQ